MNTTQITSQQQNIQQTNKTLLLFSQQILNQPQEKRNNPDINKIIQYLLQSNIISHFAQLTSLSLVHKLITKYAKIIRKIDGSILTTESEDLNFIYILLKGKLVSDKPRKSVNLKQLENIHKAVIQGKLGKKAKKAKAKDKQKEQQEDLRISKNIRQTKNIRESKNPKQIKNQKIEKQKQTKKKQNKSFDTQIIGIQDLSFGQNKYITSTTSLKQTYLLQIDVQGFLELLSNFYAEKINKVFEKLTNFACFAQIEQEKIFQLIMNFSEKQQKRGFSIYKQNEEVSKIYLLLSGEIKLTKQSNFFMENPNEFFANRAQLLRQTPKKQNISRRYSYKSPKNDFPQQQTLPFGSQTMRLFTSSPQKKRTIEISQLSSFCFFGVQELLQNKTRQTNAICHSLDVTYYQIEIERIKQIWGSKSLIKFMKGLRLQSTFKVLHRQNNLATIINLGDNSNKINNSLQHNQNDDKLFRISKPNKNKKQDQSQFTSLQHKNIISPQYTMFNFHKTGKSTKKIPINHPQKHQNPQSKLKAEFKKQQQETQKHNAEQLKIMNISHTWKLIKNKVDRQIAKSTKISPIKHSIDVNEPLIANDFLKHLEKQKIRIEKKIRKDKITVGHIRHSSLAPQTNI